MQSVKTGHVVTVTYEGFLANGDAFDSSEDSGPMRFQIGANSVMPGFDKGIMGMTVGETKEVDLAPEEAYGPRKEELIHTVSRSMWKKEQEIKPGLIVGLTIEKDGENHQVPALVTQVENDQVTVDFNHPLAGQQLIYKITLDAIEEPPEQENQAPASLNTCSPSGCEGCSSC